jgi:hypothetical protein
LTACSLDLPNLVKQVVAWILIALGVLLIGTYVAEALLAPWGEADQSLLFWYLPFATFGAISLLSGIALLRAARG